MGVEVRLPQWGMGMQEGTVLRWLKNEGDAVREGEPVAEVEAAKVNEEVESPASGTLTRILIPEGGTAPVRATLAVIATADDDDQATPARPPSAGEQATAEASSAAVATPRPARVAASPRARKLAAQLGVDLAQLQGTGPAGRITDEDVRRATGPSTAPEQTSDEPAVVGFSGMRRTIAERMHGSLQTMAQVTLTGEVDVTELVQLRQELEPGLDATYTDWLVKAVAVTLQEHPRLNARLEGDQITLLPEIHVGVAVALADGLIVPVVRNASTKSLAEISAETRSLAEQARAGTLGADQATGGTFTVTNLGGFGVDAFTPIINPPEAATLGVGRIVERPTRDGDEMRWRRVVTLSLTFDHRIVDGAPAAALLQSLRQRLADPRPLTQ